MASLELRNIRKAYGDTLVLDDVSLSMEAREFIAFLGPSGQRQIDPAADHRRARDARQRRGLAGGASASTSCRPGERGVAMVFQHYALYPHMTRAREHGVRAAQRARARRTRSRRRVAEAARVLEIEEPARQEAGADVGRPAPARRDRPRDRQAARSCSCSTSRCPTSTRRCACAPGSSSRSCASGSTRR